MLKKFRSFLREKTWEYVFSKAVWSWFLGTGVLQAIHPCENFRLFQYLVDSYQKCSSVICYLRQLLPCDGAKSYFLLLKSEETWLAILFIAYIPALNKRTGRTYLFWGGWLSDMFVAASSCAFFLSLGYVISDWQANIPLAYGSLILFSVFTFASDLNLRTDNKDANTACFIFSALMGGTVSYFEGSWFLSALALGSLYCIMAISYIDQYRNPFYKLPPGWKPSFPLNSRKP